MPAIKNWRELVTDDVTLVFDFDTPCFNAASAAETSHMKIIHKASGKEVFKEKGKPVIRNVRVDNEDGSFHFSKVDTGEVENIRFKNITEFWGRKKKAIEGWLGDLNAQRVSQGKQPYSKEDFDIQTEYVVGEVSHAIHNLKMKVAAIKEYLGIDRAIYIIGEGENHRHKLPLPIVPEKGSPHGQYKSGRIDSRRPALLKEVREWAVRSLGAKNAPAGYEADEIVTAYGWKSHLHYKKTGKHTHILVSIDKDAMGTSCLIFNPFINPSSDKKVWEHPYPYLVDGLGSLYMKNGEVKGEGQIWLLAQMLNGDSSDFYSPTARLGVTGGHMNTYLRLSPCKTLPEALKAVCDQFKEWFPEGVKFTAWDGSEQDLTWLEWANIIFKCAYMLKGRNDTLTFTKLLEMNGVEH